MTLSSTTLYESALPHLNLLHRGKVRDIFEVDDKHILIVTTDRLSAFDVILPDPIPDKGRLLTEVSNFWFHYFESLIPNHLSDISLSDVITASDQLANLKGRAIVVKKLNVLPIEAVARGYLIGSGWKDYQASNAVCGIELPAGLQQAEQLDSPIYTPATKADVGKHDMNISFEETSNLIGAELAGKVRDVTLNIYSNALEYARERGIIIADTKFEFGTNEDGQLILIDEVLTPDSSRFWPIDSYQVGSNPPSFDKQYVRDYLETLDWNKQAPGPSLPEQVIDNTARKYREARNRLIDS